MKMTLCGIVMSWVPIDLAGNCAMLSVIECIIRFACRQGFVVSRKTSPYVSRRRLYSLRATRR